MWHSDDIPSSSMSFNANIHLSVVVPVYNEEEVLSEFHNRLTEVLNTMPVNAEIVYVNDGSSDKTILLLHSLQGNDPRITIFVSAA